MSIWRWDDEQFKQPHATLVNSTLQHIQYTLWPADAGNICGAPLPLRSIYGASLHP